jgi:hypothetical protein
MRRETTEDWQTGSGTTDPGIHAKTSETNSPKARPGQACFERHYSVSEVARLWNLSERTIRRLFAEEPDIVEFGHEESLHKRAYRTVRIPESVLLRVHSKLKKVI